MKKNDYNSNLSAATVILSIIFGSILGIFLLYVTIGWAFVDGVPAWLNIIAAIIGSMALIGTFSMEDEKKRAEEEKIQREKEQIELLRKINEKQ